ncbi:MAG: transpeptidase [Pelagibacteraceae bacterium]|nr:MAG: transpeptidase [Pelagibacteraceae bacterium]
MIIVKEPGYLIFKNFKFRCSLGKNGIANKKKEGDGITPTGIFRLTKVFYREDRVKNIKAKIKKVKIKKNMGWCDDSKSKFYNKLVKIPSKFGHEKLYRKDNIYNIVVVLDYNMNPVMKNKGSAIFIHVAKKNYTTTQGCLGLQQKDLIKLIRIAKKKQKIKII